MSCREIAARAGGVALGAIELLCCFVPRALVALVASRCVLTWHPYAPTDTELRANPHYTPGDEHVCITDDEDDCD